MLTVVPDDRFGDVDGKDDSPSRIDEIVREGARRMLAEALRAEVDAYIAQFTAERDENGRRLVVRNGYHGPRTVLTSAGAVEGTVPRVNHPETPGAEAVFPGDFAALGAEDPEDHRSAAAAVPARAVQRGLRARPRSVPGLGGRAVGGGDPSASKSTSCACW